MFWKILSPETGYCSDISMVLVRIGLVWPTVKPFILSIWDIEFSAIYWYQDTETCTCKLILPDMRY